MAERPWKQPPNLLSLGLGVLLVACYFGTFPDLDYTWQIRTGQHIVETGRLQPEEAFSYTIQGQPVPDFEWLYEVLLWALWTTCGYGGLKLLKTLLVATPLLLVALHLRREGLRWPGIALAVFLGIGVLCPGWNLRALYFSTLGLLLLTGWLHDHCNGRRPLSLWLPVVMVLWSNLHPGVIMGQALLVGAIAWEWLNRRLRLNVPLDRAACWRLTGVGGLGLLATFLSPDPVGRLLYPFRPELKHPIFQIFTEVQPLYTFLDRPPFGVALAYLVAACVALSVVLRFRQYRLWEVALLAVLTLLANRWYRSLQDWLLVLLMLGGPHLYALLQSARKADPAQQPLRTRAVLELARGWHDALSRPLLQFQWFWPTAVLGVLAVVSLVPPLGRRVPNQEMDIWPVAAVDWIEAQGIQGRFFGQPNYGAYLGWRLGDRSQCYVDTRGFFFPPELIVDSDRLPRLCPDWRARLDRVLGYGTDYFLLETEGPRGQLWQLLQPHVGKPLYEDKETVLLSAAQVRRCLDRLDAGATHVANGQ